MILSFSLCFLIHHSQALELPGNGRMRMAGSVREYACPSEGEEQAALYNIACCYCCMGRPQAALPTLTALLDSGFDDIRTLESDPDLAPLRALKEYQDIVGGLRGGMLGGLFKQKKGAKGSTNQPWVQW